MRFASAFLVSWLPACGAGEGDGDPACRTGDGVTLLETVPSPDGRRAALVLQTNGGSTTRFGTLVCLEEDEGAQVLAVSGRSPRASVRWISATELQISALGEGVGALEVDTGSPWTLASFPEDGSIGCGESPCPPRFVCREDRSCWLAPAQTEAAGG